MSNVTVDDTSPTLSYGPGWGVAASDDAALGQYFQSTYHASETTGALVNLSFDGLATALYLYGSKGPDHGNFSVRYDTLFEPGLSAHADIPKYQQLLFKATFAPRANPHTLTLNNTSVGQGGKWVDVDFLTITTGNSSVSHAFSSTISPLPIPSSTSNPDGSQTPSATGPLAPNGVPSTVPASSPSGPALILSIVFGILLFFILFGVAAYFIRRHIRAASNKSDQVSSRPQQTAGSAFHDGQNSLRFSSHKGQDSVGGPSIHSTPGGSNVRATFDPIVPFNDIETEPDMREAASSQGHASAGHGRAWSPLTSPIRALFGGVKDGADSMKSTFLKV